MKVLTKAEVEEKLKDFEFWVYDEDMQKLAGEFEFETFLEAVDFVKDISKIAEKVKHHPDILIHNYNLVTIFTSTHEPEGITEKDFELIEMIESENES